MNATKGIDTMPDDENIIQNQGTLSLLYRVTPPDIFGKDLRTHMIMDPARQS